MPRGFHTNQKNVSHTLKLYLNHIYFTIDLVKFDIYSGQKVPCGTYMVPRILGKVSRTGLIWFPVKPAKSPHGTPSYFTIIFHQFIFTLNIWHPYHVETHLSGYILLELCTPTSIIPGVGGGSVRVGQQRSGWHGVWRQSGLLFLLWPNSRAG